MACATKFEKEMPFLNRENNNEKKNLYRKIVNLPFAEYESKFLVDWKTVINSQHISEEEKKFLEYRFKIKEKWVKCYMKTTFM